MLYSPEYEMFLKVNDIFLISSSVIGIVGNMLMIVIYTRPRMRHLSVSTYFCAEAAAALLVNLMIVKFYAERKLEFFVADRSDFACQLNNFIQKLFRSSCVWFQVLAGVDQFMTIVFSKRFKLIHTIRFKMVMILVLVAFNGCIASHVFFDNALHNYFNILTRERKLKCANLIDFENVFLETISFLVVPFLILLASSIATLVAILTARRKAFGLRELGNEKKILNFILNFNSKKKMFIYYHFDFIKQVVRMRDNHSVSISRNSCTSSTRSRDRKFGVTIITMNVAFLFFNLPHPIVNYCLLIFKGKWWIASEWFFIIAKCISDLNCFYFSSLFLVQLVFNRVVRKEFLTLKGDVYRKISFFKEN